MGKTIEDCTDIGANIKAMMTVHVHYTADSLTIFTSHASEEYSKLGCFALSLDPLHYSREARYLFKRLRRLGLSVHKSSLLAKETMDSMRVHEERVVYDW